MIWGDTSDAYCFRRISGGQCDQLVTAQTRQLVAQKALEQNLRMKPSLKVEPHEGFKRPTLRKEDGPHAFKFGHDSCGRAFHGELKFRFTRQQLC